MTTWQTIFGVDSPVRGSTTEMWAARSAFENMRADAQTIVDLFATIHSNGAAPDHLEGQAGVMLANVLDEVDGGLQVLPGVASSARDVFEEHYNRLVDLHEAADSALARARTAWNRRNELDGDISSLQGQLDDLQGQIDDAEPDADTSSIDSEVTGTSSSLTNAREERDGCQTTLDGICGNEDSEWVGLRADEDGRNTTTIETLDDLDLGDLEDPSWFENLVGAIADFVGGILESIANLLEAFVTGDWATFFWELKGLMEAALLVLGTIALFTGIGSPLGALLIGLSVASFAVNVGLYATQTPNPQTGETVGLGDVLVSGVSAVFAGATMLTTLRQVTALNVAAGSGANATNTVASVFRANNAIGLQQGALFQFGSNLGRNSVNGMTWVANQTGRYGTLPYRVPTTPQPGWFTNAASPASWEVVTTAVPTPGGSPSTMADRFSNKLTVGGFDNFNVANSPGGGQGTPLFGPAAPTPQQVAQVSLQMQGNPDVHIVPAG